MGIVTKSLNWITHPTFDTDTDPVDWLAGLALILIAAFLWSRVIKEIVNV